MIHAENERFSISMLRGVAYALTVFRVVTAFEIDHDRGTQKCLLIFNPDLWHDHTGCKSGEKFATEPNNATLTRI
jgi:hypothetical protein